MRGDAQASVGPRSILIVEYDPLHMKLAETVLERRGFLVLCAADATEALAILGAIRPHLILMDLQLPGQSGFALTRQLKADPTRCDVVIVALTSSAMLGDEAKAREAGCDGYLTKPIHVPSFAATVGSFLR